METRVNYTVVGLFVLVFGSGIVVSTLWFAAGGIEPEMSRYLVFTGESVDGLNVGSPVSYNGVDVGRVENISLDPQDPQRVRLLLEIEKGTPVKEDTVAQVEYQSYVTGLKFVNLTGGSPESPPLTGTADDLLYPVIPTRPSLTASLEELLPELAERLDAASADLARITERTAALLSEKNLRALERTILSIDKATGRLSEQTLTLGRTLSNTERLTAEAADSLPALLATTRQALGDARQAMQSIDSAASEIGETSGEFQADLVPGTRRLLEDLSSLAGTLDRFSERLERQPSVLLFGRERSPGPGERR